MNATLRALLFGTAVAAALTVTVGTVTAAETPRVVRLDAVSVVAHHDAFDADGNVKAIRLEPIVVTGHRDAQ